MTLSQHIKLVLRSWWHSKLFVFISLVSLTVGITCTCLLVAFVLHESFIEGDNPNRNRIVRLTQTLPILENEEENTYVYGEEVPQIISRLPEVKTYLRTLYQEKVSASTESATFFLQNVLAVDSTFCRFFPYKTIQGSLQETLTRPDCVALTEKTAIKIFGSTDCIGKTFTISAFQHPLLVRVTAIIRPSSLHALQADVLLTLPDGLGNNCYLLLHPETDIESFRKHLAKEELPTLLGTGHYHAQSLQESYFDIQLREGDGFLHRNPQTLIIGLLAAILILVIGCCNYINLGFTRLLKQFHTLRVETLMGASRKDIRKQLFTDTLLMIFIAFLLSLLLMHDAISLFNQLVNAQLSYNYLFSLNVLPLLIGFVLLIGILPASYMSWKIPHLTESNYRLFYTGKKRRLISGILQTFQFTVSLGLLSAFLIIQGQVQKTESARDRFKGDLTIYSPEGSSIPITTWTDEIRNWKDVEAVTSAQGGFNSWGMAAEVSGQKDKYHMVELIDCCPDFLSFYQIEVLDKTQMENLMKSTPKPVLANERFVKLFIPSGESPIGQPMTNYIKDDYWKDKVIIGVVKDIILQSLGKPVNPLAISVYQQPTDKFDVLIVRPSAHASLSSLLQKLQKKWETNFPDNAFDIGQTVDFFNQQNQHTFLLSNITLFYATISLLLTLFGLFGQIRYSIRLRLKELCIRRIHGASPFQVLLQLERPFVTYLSIAFLISTPVTYIWMSRWLEGFAYRIDISCLHFLFPLLLISLFTLVIIGVSSYQTIRTNPVRFLRIE
ncbi:FtsX-like permease family protein [uncultured Bacteroides sp.]|uniref:FtsX-like permease family protein n=1 Tax=uncultured Bacteroides sp. TaxID=162156 RepID=UPI002613518E|nr:ABC transporter permease [uncultured Bacteroides sp.]